MVPKYSRENLLASVLFILAISPVHFGDECWLLGPKPTKAPKRHGNSTEGPSSNLIHIRRATLRQKDVWKHQFSPFLPYMLIDFPHRRTPLQGGSSRTTTKERAIPRHME